MTAVAFTTDGVARNGPRTGFSGRHRGFTVVELLTALAITATALSLTYGTFRLALNAEERGMARMELLQRGDAAMEMMARDLRSAINLGSEENYIFESTDESDGDMAADTLGFVSTVNNPRTQTALCYDLARIQYYLDFDDETSETGLVRSQINFPIPEAEEDLEAAMQTLEVLPTAESLSILLYDNASGEWVENWDEMEGMPGAVKLELVMLMVQPQAEAEDEEDETETVELAEPKSLTLLVHLPASRWEPTAPEELGGAGGEPGGNEDEGRGEPEEPGGAGRPGGQEIPEIPQPPGFPGGGGGGR
ncbi:MAG: prepilin-type N-terminal cleavage/methylation domain-containing protein [Armatimonadota bacterium]|jgi:type II secretion system protein J